MIVTFESGELIRELKRDILEFGTGKEIAVWCRDYEGVTLYTNYDFINDEKINSTDCNSVEYIKIMTMGELLPLLERQNAII